MLVLTTYDFNKNQILNAAIHNAASAPSTPVKGQVYYNTASNHAFIYNGTVWEQMSGEVMSIASVNGFSGSVSGYAISLSTSVTGILKGSTGALVAASGSDFPSLDTITAPAGPLSLNGQKITNLASGSVASDAATYGQLISLTNGLIWKNLVIVASTGNLTLSGEQTIDGVLTAGSRVLVKNQTVASQNGIYVTSSSAWTRSSDMAAGSNAAGAAVYVNQGTTQSTTQWTCSSPSSAATVGTNNLSFVQFSAGVSYTAGAGISIAGNVISVSGYIGSNTITTLGTITTGIWQGTPVDIAHGGTGATTAAAALTALGAYPSSNPAGYTVLPAYTLANVGQVLGVIDVGGVATLAWVDQTGGGSTTPSLNYSVASNSQYSLLLLGW